VDFRLFGGLVVEAVRGAPSPFGRTADLRSVRGGCERFCRLEGGFATMSAEMCLDIASVIT